MQTNRIGNIDVVPLDRSELVKDPEFPVGRFQSTSFPKLKRVILPKSERDRLRKPACSLM